MSRSQSIRRRSVPGVTTAWLAFLALASLPAVAAAQASSQPAVAAKARAFSAHYRIRYLGPHVAEQLAWEQCPAKDCMVYWVSGELEVNADASTHERLARAFAREDAPRTQSFQLTLLAADNHGGGAGAAPELSKAALKALQDMKDFLPFKSYRLLDMAWLRTTGSAEAHLGGDDQAAYTAELQFARVGDPAAKELLVERFVLRALLSPRPRAAAPAASGKAALETPGPLHEDLIRTTFGIHVGETVVVGTSKLGGDSSALVVLLTAVP
jgi:hypothetical protein